MPSKKRCVIYACAASKPSQSKNGMSSSVIVRTLKRAIIAQMEWIMPDITMCENDACPMRQHCYRFMAKPDAWQSIACFKPLSDTECEYFIALKRIEPTL